MATVLKPTRYAVSYLIFNSEDESLPLQCRRFMMVQRPADDENVATANAWGLPAGYRAADQAWEDAVRVSGAQKLGVKLEPLRLLNKGVLQRAEYILEMQQWEAVVVEGTPSVPQAVAGVTQYQNMRMDGRAEMLRPAAAVGSLCSRLFLDVAAKAEQDAKLK